MPKEEKNYLKDFFFFHSSNHEAKGFIKLFDNEENLSIPILFPFSREQAENEIYRLQKKLNCRPHGFLKI